MLTRKVSAVHVLCALCCCFTGFRFSVFCAEEDINVVDDGDAFAGAGGVHRACDDDDEMDLDDDDDGDDDDAQSPEVTDARRWRCECFFLMKFLCFCCAMCCVTKNNSRARCAKCYVMKNNSRGGCAKCYLAQSTWDVRYRYSAVCHRLPQLGGQVQQHKR
jgi:hypothetical protein